jgi:hypothetical protein
MLAYGASCTTKVRGLMDELLAIGGVAFDDGAGETGKVHCRVAGTFERDQDDGG